EAAAGLRRARPVGGKWYSGTRPERCRGGYRKEPEPGRRDPSTCRKLVRITMLRRNIACTVTLINLCCGFLAINLHMMGMNALGMTVLIVAFLGDGVDGYLARKLNQTSAFGERLDSLADLVSFGLAPVFFALS